MSVFNAISTAVSGINAQSTAFSNLSNNIANSQTVGYKADSTAFQDFVSGQLINSSRNEGNSDSVAAVTIQHVDKQGTSTISNDSLAMSIQGSGLFNVTKAPADQGNSTSMSQTRYYTRNGEFYEDKNGYLVNTSGYYLNGYNMDNAVDPKTNQVVPKVSNTLSSINVADIQYTPITNPTVSVKGFVGYAGTANADGTTKADTPTGTPTDSPQTVTLYDSRNDAHNVQLNWSYDTADRSVNTTRNPQTWKLTVKAAEANTTVNGNTDQTYYVNFDSTTGAIQSVSTQATGGTNLIANNKSSVDINLQYPDLNTGASTTLPFKLNLGTQGSTAGATLSTTASPVITTPTTDSKSSSQVGSYSGVEIESDGSIMAKFSLGDTQLIGKVALTNFASVNNLQAVSGQAYLATPSAGTAQTGVVGENGTGSLTVGYTESSTTDLTSDLSALIIAQQAYTANTKVVTTASELLQTTIAMKQ